MIEDRSTPRSSFFDVGRISVLAAQCIIAGGVLFAADGLGHLRLQPFELIGVCLVFGASRLLAALLSIRSPERRMLAGVADFVFPAVLWWAINSRFQHPLSAEKILYLSTLLWLVQLLWRSWKSSPGLRGACEQGNRLVVVFAAAWAVFPLFVDRLGGGVDARWYATVLADFIEQQRAGKAFVFVGQGPYVFNGGVHPFRTAPLYMWTAGIWDFITARQLNVLALQHLSAITAALFGALAAYSGLLKIVPRRPWVAALVSAAYILSPAVLAPLYCADMYMTFMTLAALPLVFCGNARFLIHQDKSAGRLLAVGLVMTWMSHPPTAMEATLATVFIQLTGWICSEESVVSFAWRGGRAALWFIALGAYYFASMSELPPQPGAPVKPDVIMVAGLCLAWIAAGRGLLWRQWGWACAAIPAALIVYKFNPAWAYWVGTLCVICFVAGFWIRRIAMNRRVRWSPTVLVVAAMAAAAISWYLARAKGFAAEESAWGGF